MAKRLVDDTNAFAVKVLCCSRLDKVIAYPAIQPGNESRLQGPFDVTKQNNAALGAMAKISCSTKPTSIAPSAKLTINIDTALI
jgi:hypothetical protein